MEKDGENIVYTKKKDKAFLIHILTQEVFYNEQPCTIIYFRDVTFGVLYEQIKAEQKFDVIVNNTI
jgi:hypothetical protein